jgi:hypothetical protein
MSTWRTPFSDESVAVLRKLVGHPFAWLHYPEVIKHDVYVRQEDCRPEVVVPSLSIRKADTFVVVESPDTLRRQVRVRLDDRPRGIAYNPKTGAVCEPGSSLTVWPQANLKRVDVWNVRWKAGPIEQQAEQFLALDFVREDDAALCLLPDWDQPHYFTLYFYAEDAGEKVDRLSLRHKIEA